MKSYRFAFNGQEQDNEVAGIGNSMTAEFWQYDTRLGKRWNVDPVVKVHESPYACFANNPIWFADPYGNDTLPVNSMGNGEKDLSEITVTASKDDNFYSQENERYGYNGTFTAWKEEVGLNSSVNYPTAASYYWQSYSHAYNYWVDVDDAEERLHRTQLKLWWFGLTSDPIFSVLSPSGGGGPINGARFSGAKPRGLSLDNARLRSLSQADETFFTVQGPDDVARLLSGGKPWPQGPTKASLGEGLYVWGSLDDAITYKTIMGRYYDDLVIMEIKISSSRYHRLNSINVNKLSPNNQSQFMDDFYMTSKPHGYNHVIAPTNSPKYGSQFYFGREMYWKLRFSRFVF